MLAQVDIFKLATLKVLCLEQKINIKHISIHNIENQQGIVILFENGFSYELSALGFNNKPTSKHLDFIKQRHQKYK